MYHNNGIRKYCFTLTGMPSHEQFAHIPDQHLVRNQSDPDKNSEMGMDWVGSNLIGFLIGIGLALIENRVRFVLEKFG